MSAACLALACGNDNSNGDDPNQVESEPPTDDVELPEDGECDTNEFLEDCEGQDPVGAAGAGAGGTSSGPPPPKTPQELAKDQVENILKANCGSCHGTQLTERNARGGMNYINDLEVLAEREKLVPGDSAASLIIQKMRSGAMPPPGEGGQRVSDAEIAIIAAYIDNPNYWDIRTVCTDNPPLSFDDLYGAVADDLSDAEADDAPFLRYVSLDNRVGAGVCNDTALDLDRQGLVKLINMLSTDPTVVRPEPLNRESTLYRIDIRDLRWNREVVVDGETFADVWEAIVAANQYAIPFVGEDADDARADAQTDVPVMFLDSMLDAAAIGNLYYAIIDVDVNQTIDTFVSDVLGIDVQANIDDEEVIRAGTTKSRISRQDRLIEGHRIEERPGVYYQSFDFADDANDSIFENAFGFNEGGREAIFTLPNGMLAYLIADANGNLVQDSDILLDTDQSNYRAVTSVSCANCHVGGLIPVVDEVRDIVLRNAVTFIQGGNLNQEQLEQLEKIYLEPDDFKQQVEEDSQAFYLNALEQANVPVSGAEPVSSVFLRFDLDMTLRDAAGDLGVSAEALDRDLNLLDPVLGVLGAPGGSIDRDDFTAEYLASLCRLSAVNDNRPDDALCDAVLEQ